MYARETVAEVLAATDIVDLIGANLTLKSAGANRFKALCPFHTEKTPSFTVSRDRQMFKCFGCGKGGDAISFIVEFEGLTFKEALEKLADAAGVRLPRSRGGSDMDESQRKELFALAEFATAFYRKQFNLSEMAQGYVAKRELKNETVERFALGFAPDSWTTFVDAARSKGYNEKILEASGLIRPRQNGGHYDFFRNRLIFPIKNLAGKVVAFGGRTLGDDVAKYVNSPENRVYKKSQTLYGLHEARQAMRQSKSAILVEGYFDVLRCVDAGIENVVATCGTALTEDQGKLLRRYVPEVVVVYDGDPAGMTAAARGFGVLLQAGLTVRAVSLPDGQDPDDFIRNNGKEKFMAAVEAAKDFVSFYAAANQDRLGTIEGRTEVARGIFSVLKGIPDPMRRAAYLNQISDALKLDEWSCRSAFEEYLRGERRRDRFRNDSNGDEPEDPSVDDTDFLAAILHETALMEETIEAVKDINLPDGPLTEILEGLTSGARGNLSPWLESDGARALYASAATTEPLEGERARWFVRRRLASFRRRHLQQEARRVRAAMEEAASANDSSRLSELFQEKVGIDRKIQEMGVI